MTKLTKSKTGSSSYSEPLFATISTLLEKREEFVTFLGCADMAGRVASIVAHHDELLTQ